MVLVSYQKFGSFDVFLKFTHIRKFSVTHFSFVSNKRLSYVSTYCICIVQVDIIESHLTSVIYCEFVI